MSEQQEDLFRVVFAGQITGDFSLTETKARFARAFKLTPAKTERFFSGRDVVLKSGMPESKAMDFAVRLAEIGCETYIETVPNEPNFEERRSTIRRIRFRRGPRPGAIVPDRRKVPSRRADDIKMLQQTGDFPGNTVGPEDKENGDS